MDQKTLASMLNISPGMVTKLKKRGMPIDSFERAQRWRKRHLEPSRVKGVRFDPNAPEPAPRPAAPPAPLPNLANTARALAKAVDAELQAGDAELIDLEPLRDCLRAMRTPFPAMPIRVWIALVDAALLDQSPVRSHREQGLPVTADEFAELVAPGLGGGALWADFACNPLDLDAEDDDWS